MTGSESRATATSSGVKASKGRNATLACGGRGELRNLVEQCFNKLKNARRVATRYDKRAESFLGFADITPIRLRLRHWSTWPSLCV